MTIDDGSKEEKLCGIYEGFDVPNMTVSSGNELTVKFESSYWTHMEGFAATLFQGMYVICMDLKNTFKIFF